MQMGFSASRRGLPLCRRRHMNEEDLIRQKQLDDMKKHYEFIERIAKALEALVDIVERIHRKSNEKI